MSIYTSCQEPYDNVAFLQQFEKHHIKVLTI